MTSALAHRLALAAAGAAVAGCSATVHTMIPYRDDAALAAGLERRAAGICGARRGESDLPPRRFTTDGCSMWIDGGWVECCVEHDIAYWCGGSWEDRRRADDELRRCVAQGHGTGLGRVMYWGVRAGGGAWLPFSWRWGYGWPWPRGYDAE